MKYSYTQGLDLSYQALDLFPVKDFLEQDRTLTEVINIINQELMVNANTYQKLWNFLEAYEDHFQGNIFNYMTDYEFLVYCQKHFPDIKWGHEIVDKYWVAN